MLVPVMMYDPDLKPQAEGLLNTDQIVGVFPINDHLGEMWLVGLEGDSSTVTDIEGYQALQIDPLSFQPLTLPRCYDSDTLEPIELECRLDPRAILMIVPTRQDPPLWLVAVTDEIGIIVDAEGHRLIQQALEPEEKPLDYDDQLPPFEVEVHDPNG